jgi:hypothetical protein
MSKETPDHHDAQLALQVYDLRREAVMRESRNKLAQFWPKSFDDLLPLTKPDHPLNAAWRQCATYWEMVYGMVRHGLVHPDYFLETNGEGFFLFAKIHPYLEQYRKETGAPQALGNTEWVATQTATGRRMFEGISARVQKILASR